MQTVMEKYSNLHLPEIFYYWYFITWSIDWLVHGCLGPCIRMEPDVEPGPRTYQDVKL